VVDIVLHRICAMQSCKTVDIAYRRDQHAQSHAPWCCKANGVGDCSGDIAMQQSERVQPQSSGQCLL
jgi:hypothetical protein